MNERLLRALMLEMRYRATFSTPRHVETVAASYIHDNLAAALGEPVESELLMEPKRVERILAGQEVWQGGFTGREVR